MEADLEKLANSGVRLQKAIAMGPEGLAETLSGKGAKTGKKKPKATPKMKRGRSSY